MYFIVLYLLLGFIFLNIQHKEIIEQLNEFYKVQQLCNTQSRKRMLWHLKTAPSAHFLSLFFKVFPIFRTFNSKDVLCTVCKWNHLCLTPFSQHQQQDVFRTFNQINWTKLATRTNVTNYLKSNVERIFPIPKPMRQRYKVFFLLFKVVFYFCHSKEHLGS